MTVSPIYYILNRDKQTLTTVSSAHNFMRYNNGIITSTSDFATCKCDTFSYVPLLIPHIFRVEQLGHCLCAFPCNLINSAAFHVSTQKSVTNAVFDIQNEPYGIDAQTVYELVRTSIGSFVPPHEFRPVESSCHQFYSRSWCHLSVDSG